MTFSEIDFLVTSAASAMLQANKQMLRASMAIIDLLVARNQIGERLIGGITVRRRGYEYVVFADGIDYDLDTGFLAFGYLMAVWLDIKSDGRRDGN